MVLLLHYSAHLSPFSGSAWLDVCYSAEHFTVAGSVVVLANFAPHVEQLQIHSLEQVEQLEESAVGTAVVVAQVDYVVGKEEIAAVEEHSGQPKSPAG